MHSVSRPTSIDYTDPQHGVHFVLAFKWGSSQIPEPEAVVLLCKLEGQDSFFVADIVRGSWLSFEESVTEGKEAALRFLKRYGAEGLTKAG
ncbi:hypothetical protein [Pseudomonas sp. Marseille-QA0892]